MYKILALDIDGTLTNSKKEVTDRTKAALSSLYERNIPVLLVSGRPTEGIFPVAKEINLEENNGYILAFNGGKILNASTGEIIYQKSVPYEYVKEICDFAVENDLAVLTYKDGDIISNKPDDEYVQIEARINKLKAVKVDDVAAVAPENPDKFLIVGPPDIIAEKLPIMQEKFAGRLNIFCSEPFFMEIVPLGIDKAQSLDLLLSKLSLQSSELVACGDGGNDVTMIKYAGMGVAMANACKAVLDAADYVTLSNDEDGVAVAIEKFF